MRRYAGKAARGCCPELQGSVVDLPCPAEDLDSLPEVIIGSSALYVRHWSSWELFLACLLHANCSKNAAVVN